MKQLVLCLALCGWAGAASAQRFSPVDGNKLLAMCVSKATIECDAYLSGVGDAIAAAGPGKALACIPKSVTGGQLRDVTIKFLKSHPEKRQLKAGVLVTRGFSEAFPCKP